MKRYQALFTENDHSKPIIIRVSNEEYPVDLQNTVDINTTYATILQTAIFSRLRDRTGTCLLSIKINKNKFIELLHFLYLKNNRTSYNAIKEVLLLAFNTVDFLSMSTNRVKQDTYWSNYKTDFNLKFTDITNCDTRFDSTDYLKCTLCFVLK